MSTIEGGMISTNDADLYDLMKMKRSHGLARASQHFDSYVEKNPEIDRSFLFVSDGYNFRNTEISAHLGLRQIKKLDSYIETRRKNFSVFCGAINSSDLFYPIDNNPDNSSFCFPFICKDRETKFNLMSKFIENGIESLEIDGVGSIPRDLGSLGNIGCTYDNCNYDTICKLIEECVGADCGAFTVNNEIIFRGRTTKKRTNS